jgi:hypothetical protein
MNIQGIQPNAADGLSCLNVVANTSSRLILKILDVQGRIAKTVIKTVEQGAHELMLNLNDLGEGNYVLNAFNGESFVKALRFTKE